MLVSGYLDRPDYRVDLLPRRNRVTVMVDGKIIASSARSILVDEQNHALVFYLPPEDVDFDLLVAIDDKRSVCPFKGEARYLAHVDRPEAIIAWTYPDVFPQVAAIAGYVAFYQDRVDIIVGDAEQPV